MRAIFRLFAVSIGLIAAASLACAEPIPLSDVLASPTKYHHAVIQISGVFWTDGEGALLIEAPTKKLDLERAIAVSPDRKVLATDENHQRLNADRLAYIQKRKAEDPNATWIVFQTAVIFEGQIEDALRMPIPKGSDYRVLNPYQGCRIKIDLRRVISYGVIEQKANHPPEPTPGAVH